jgi:quinohemoprotein ethanol dehydrogenase
MAAPMTYEVDGEQYIAVLVGWGGTYPLVPGVVSHKSGNLRNISRVLVFKLGATGKLPPPPPLPQLVLNNSPDTADAATIQTGKASYARFCSSCHGDAAVSGGIIPDLRYSAYLGDDTFHDVVLGGALKTNGMASFTKVLDRPGSEAVRAYLIRRAHESRTREGALKSDGRQR